MVPDEASPRSRSGCPFFGGSVATVVAAQVAMTLCRLSEPVAPRPFASLELSGPNVLLPGTDRE